MSTKNELSDGSMSILSWKVGQTPNLGLLYLSSLCCCWLGYYFHLYNLYKELNRFFPKYDISLAIVKALFPIISWFTLDGEIEALAREANVTVPKAKFPALVCLLCGVLSPYVLADQMTRVNELCKAAAEKGDN